MIEYLWYTFNVLAILDNSESFLSKERKQAGAEQCQAQESLGKTLRSSSI
jgi:hypothetical protein